MTSRNRVSLVGIFSLVMGVLLLAQVPALAQTVVSTIPLKGVGQPQGVAVNSVTNKIYVADYGGGAGGTVAVIDGATDSTATVAAGIGTIAVALNPVTNKIYVVNRGYPIMGIRGSITVIDGATNSTTTVIDPNATFPSAVAVNPMTNKIYVTNSSHNVTVIDGDTNSTTTVTDPNAAFPVAVAVNPATNKIYVANVDSGNVTVIDGDTNSTTTVPVTSSSTLGPVAIAVDPVTNKIYVAYNGVIRLSTAAGNVTVIDGATNSTTTVTDPNAITPVAVAVNMVTNKIYVTNEGNYPGANHGNITVIDGATNSTTTITDPNALAPLGVAVNPVTNTIYVTNGNSSTLSGNGGVTVIDGASNSTTTVIDPNAKTDQPAALAVDPATDRIYVANAISNNVTVIDGDKATPVSFALSVRFAMDGLGDVISNPAGIKCGNFVNPLNPFTLCSATFAPGTMVILSASPASGSTFTGWGGACSGTGAVRCSVTMNAAESVTATFTLIAPVTLSVTKAGTGAGTVLSSPPGINCGTTCSGSFGAGTIVQLIAASDANSTFTGWGGACSGTAECSVTMNAAESVTATFNSMPEFSLTPASASLTESHGAQMIDVITVTPQNGSFANAIQLSCAVSGPAPMPTCTLSPASVTPGSNSATSTLTITAPAASAMLQPTIRGQLKLLYAAWLPLPGIVLFGIGLISHKQRDHRRKLWLLTGSLLALFAVVAGCGVNSNVTTTPSPQAQSYVVTVTGASGAIQHTTLVTVTVP